MKRSHTPQSASLLILLSLLVTSVPALAGGPLANCQSGVPFVWPNGGQNIEYNVDQGDLGPLTNADGKLLVGDAFQVWEDVATATVSFVEGPMLAVDIDITNFGPIFAPAAPNGQTEIVFDDNGEIFDLLFGPGSGVLGFAGPDFGDPGTCTILEGSAFLNGPEFVNLTAALDITVHEFGHLINLAHSVVNGQIFLGDTSGPTPDDTFGFPVITEVETMYPFYFGPGSGTATLEQDDIAILSTLYPEPTFFSTTGTVSGTILSTDGSTKLTGVNVIARNLADPFHDAVSAISSDFTDSTAQSDPVVGTYTLNGLTPGADYALFVDEILAGGFSTAVLSPLPGPEELWNGGSESTDGSTDDPLDFQAITPAAGVPVTGIDVLFNAPAPGPIPLGDDDFALLPLPFTFKLCGESFDSLFVNSNGNLTFGAPDTNFLESPAAFLSFPPRIAGLWDDLNPSAAGVVSFDQDFLRFRVKFEDVPEFPATGANTFEISLWRFGNLVTIDYGSLSAADGLAGVSCGGLNSGLEPEEQLRRFPFLNIINMHQDTAAYEHFADGDNDLDHYLLKFLNLHRTIRDESEPNDSLSRAKRERLPFDTLNDNTFIDPVGDDVDYFKVRAEGGTSLVCEVIAGDLDSVLGLFDRATGDLLAVDDDGGAGLLSRIVFPVPGTGDYGIAVSTFPDFDFNGDGGSGGRYVLDCFAVDGILLDLGDDDAAEVALGFDFPFQGASFGSVFVNSNGNLTFGGADTDFSESVGELLAELPRIAPLWDDLNPSAAGNVLVESDASSWTVTFDGVPEFASTSTNTFSVTLGADGTITFAYGDVAANDGLVGITEGGGAADPGPTDLSAGGPFPASGTTYEQFPTFDLDGATVVFEP